MSEMDLERRRMVEALAASSRSASPRVLEALSRVPRHRFLPPAAREEAYRDEPVPIGSDQTASAPHMVALMLEALDPKPGERVLEVGGGSGYHAAVAAELVGPAGRVVSVEIRPELARAAEAVLADLGYDDRVEEVVGDGAEGHPAKAPYHGIWIACAAPEVPAPLLDELAAGGRLVAPVGGPDLQELLLVEKTPEGALRSRPLGPCRFVPMVPRHPAPE